MTIHVHVHVASDIEILLCSNSTGVKSIRSKLQAPIFEDNYALLIHVHVCT